MFAALDFTALVAVIVGLALMAAWLAAQSLELVLRRRGSIWQLAPDRRSPRIIEAYFVGLLTALFAAFIAGELGRLLGMRFWYGAVPALVVSLWASYKVARAFQQTRTMGEMLIADGVAEAQLDPLPQSPPSASGRRIVILCDGTRNRPPSADDPAATNIWKLSQMLVDDEIQTIWYDPGVATGTSRPARMAAALERWTRGLWLTPLSRALGWAGRFRTAWEGLTGTGISENILEGYTEIVRQYRPGDRIYILGFSRGAYTARVIAGVIRTCGILKSSNLRYAPAVVSLYSARRGQKGGSVITGVPITDEFAWRDVPIEMLGVFDTVASLGAPLWGWWFKPHGYESRALNTSPMPNCLHVYHALAMDERRATFFPTLFWREGGTRSGWTQTLEQVWFRGVHSDIGGGYPETGTSDITLEWMLERTMRHGLVVKPDSHETLRPDPIARLHDETARRPSWNWVGTWPRWAMVLDEPPSKGAGISVHKSVFERARRVQAETGRRDMYSLRIGETVTFRADARRQWDRTGLIIHGDRKQPIYYRLRWTGGLWRDASCPPCGPSGSEDSGRFTNLRRWARWRRRVGNAPWMTLCATIAVPRRWPLRELPLREAFAYLFLRDPEPLQDQVAPVGRSLTAVGDSVLIRSERPAGMLYLFANDLWQTYPNNSGELELELTRLDERPDRAEPVWVLPVTGPWRLEST